MPTTPLISEKTKTADAVLQVLEEAGIEMVFGMAGGHTGRLFMALPPLYRISHGATTAYARDDAHKDELMATTFKGKKPDIGRFKGLGEMMPAQLKETTMDPRKRTLARVTLPRDEEGVVELVETLMGRKAELRFRFIQENAEFAAEDLDV